ncbi:MAG TPA: amidohydrolase family protein [Gemmatimonadales bacterium]
MKRTTSQVAAAGAALVLVAGVAIAQTTVITHATIVRVSGPPIANGTIVIDGERIVAVGGNVAIPAGAQVIDARGKFAYPGLIDSDTRLGLTEISSVSGGEDVSEIGTFNPAIATYIAVNPHSELIPVTRVNGVTTVVSSPSGGRIAGVATVIDLDGWSPAQMARRPLGMLVVEYPQFGAAGGGGFFSRGPRLSLEEQRRRAEQQIRELGDYFEAARSYADRKARGTLPAVDRQLEAMVPAMRGEMPVAFSANGAEEIMSAVHTAERFGLDAVIVGGRAAWEVADSLAATNVPVILGSILSNPGEDEDPFDAIYAQPSVLARAGVKFAFSTGDAANARNLPYHAQMAVAHGLDEETALRAMTLWPAQILGIDQEVGTLEAGKVANLFIADGDPMDVRTTIEQVFIRGRAIEMGTRHIHGIIVIPERATRASPAPQPRRPSGPSRRSIGAIVGSYKSAVSKRINQLRGTPGAWVWQRNYYEHVIRDIASLNRIREYIARNPARWSDDTENPRRPHGR